MMGMESEGENNGIELSFLHEVSLKKEEILLQEDNQRYESVPVVYFERESLSSHNGQISIKPNGTINQNNQTGNETEAIGRSRWKYQWCPTPYYKDECDCNYCWECSDRKCCTRGCTSIISSGVMGLCGLIKLIDWCCDNNYQSCHDACSPEVCTTIWFPTKCSDLEGVACSGLRWGCSLGFIGAGCTALSAWAPWWDDRGCILRKQVQIERDN